MFLDLEHEHPSTSSAYVCQKIETVKLKDGRKNVKAARSQTDLVLDWTDDLEITFRIVSDKRVNPDISFPLFPRPENLSKIPSLESLESR
jgi:hypothetical protein